MCNATREHYPIKMSETEYLEFERASDIKHEYINGEVYAMAGASWEHNQIFGATYASLFSQLRGKSCTVNPSDQRLKVMNTGVMTYPDISVICGEPIFAGEEFDTITNPILIIEILSPSTEAFDRGEKFQHYRQIEILQEYLLISTDQARIEKYSKQASGQWMLTDDIGLETVLALPSIDCALALADIYENISLPSKDD